jgi:hypothetical protein
MLKKEIIGKNSVFVLYVFAVSMVTAILHITFGEQPEKDQFARWLYLVLPVTLGLTGLISWKWIKLDFRITTHNHNDSKFITFNIMSLLVFTALMGCLGLHPFIDCVIVVGVIIHSLNKLIYIQTASSSVVQLPQSVREGVIKSKYFFWRLYEHDGIREFIVSPEKCSALKILSNVLEDKLVLNTKKIAHRKLNQYEKDFGKTLFDFNVNELTLVDISEI